MGVNQDLYKVGKNFRATYSKAGAPSLKKRLAKAARIGGYRNFSKEDVNFVSEILKESEKSIRKKGFMSKYVTKKAGQKTYAAYKRGDITKTDYNKAKKIYRGLGKTKQEKNKLKKIKFYHRHYLKNETSTHASIGVSNLGTKHTQARATGIAHGNTSIGQIINKPKPMKPLSISSPKPPSSNFKMAA